jgi:hypothetical protein
VRKLASVWCRSYLLALYLNFFVMLAQLFQKTPALKELAPTQSEPHFGISQGLVLIVFVVLGVTAFRRFPVAS